MGGGVIGMLFDVVVDFKIVVVNVFLVSVYINCFFWYYLMFFVLKNLKGNFNLNFFKFSFEVNFIF